ncbi:MAG: TonB family protein [Nitrospinae bacterium]|nr:TonB family protein [Nitrospinota bacterium]
MRRSPRSQQVVSPRVREIDSPSRFAGSLVVSALGHTLFLALVLFGSWLSGEEEKLVSVGYRVELISLNPSPKSERSRERPAAPAPAPEPPKTIESAPAPKAVTAPPKTAAPEKVAAAPKIVPLKSEAPRKVAEPEKPKKPERVEAAEKLKPLLPVAPVTPVRPPSLPTPAPIRHPIPDRPTDGGGGGGAASVVQGEETAYSYYMQILNDKVNENWVTLGIDINGKRANPVVRFDIDRDGRALNIRLDKTSGAPALDESALAAIRTLELPPLPSEYPTELMRIRFTFDYEQNHR